MKYILKNNKCKYKRIEDATCFWRTKIVCFTSFKGKFNPIGSETNRWKCKTGELGNMHYFYFLSLPKFGRRALKWFSSRKILFWNILKNSCGFNYFWTKIYSWAKFNSNWFFDLKRSGPVLERLPLKCCLQDVEFLRIGRSSDLSCSLNLSYTKYGELCCASFFYCVRFIDHNHRTEGKRENWGGFSRSKFTVSVISSIAVQLSDNISEIWSSIILFRGKTAFIQVFDEDIASLAIAETVKIKLLPKPVDKIAITSLLWRRL